MADFKFSQERDSSIEGMPELWKGVSEGCFSLRKESGVTDLSGLSFGGKQGVKIV